jgi:hypothetical protein
MMANRLFRSFYVLKKKGAASSWMNRPSTEAYDFCLRRPSALSVREFCAPKKKAGPKTSPLKVWERMPERRFSNASNRILLQTQKIDQHVRKKR